MTDVEITRLERSWGSTHGSPVLPPTEPVMQSLHGIARRVSEFKDGELLPGGGSIFSDELTHRLCLDLGNIEPRLRKLIEISDGEKGLELTKNSEEIRQIMYPSCDSEIFRITRSFTGWVDFRGFRMSLGQEQQREQKYFEGEHPPTLSEMLECKLAACVELSALGHHYLKMNGIDSSYMSGVFMEETHSGHGNHAWVEIRAQGRELIWDVANPHQRTYSNGLPFSLPRLLELASGSFEVLTNADRATLICGTPMLKGSQSKLYYGVHSYRDGAFNFELIERGVS